MDKRILKQQKNEITEYHIYLRLSELAKDEHNAKILKKIANQELKHYNFWKSITKKEIKPDKFRISLYVFLARFIDLSFALRFMEKGEIRAKKFYAIIKHKYPQVEKIQKDEEEHEFKLIGILNDERLTYSSSIVLGLNDALVELTGTLAGLTFALGNSMIVGITGLIMGVAASLSMAASEYLSNEEEENKEEKSSIKSALYTWTAYIISVVILVSPYFIFDNIMHAFAVMLTMTILIIFTYTFYISVAKGLNFKKKFSQMALISLSVALISFIIGRLVSIYFGIEV